MNALLEYLDLTVLLEYIDLLNRYSGGPSWGLLGPLSGWGPGQNAPVAPPCGRPCLHPCMTTEPRLSRLITSLNFYFINGNSSLISKTELPIENLEHSMCVLLDDFSESKNVHSIRALAPYYCCNTLRFSLVTISSNWSHSCIDQWHICGINLVSQPAVCKQTSMTDSCQSS